jgi:hypothetical protein
MRDVIAAAISWTAKSRVKEETGELPHKAQHDLALPLRSALLNAIVEYSPERYISFEPQGIHAIVGACSSRSQSVKCVQCETETKEGNGDRRSVCIGMLEHILDQLAYHPSSLTRREGGMQPSIHSETIGVSLLDSLAVALAHGSR